MVTAFTLAHSVTLSLAVLGVVALPARLVESAIAASVLLAALNNIYPMVTSRRWLVAFGFGLVHGLGFGASSRVSGCPEAPWPWRSWRSTWGWKPANSRS